MGFLDKLKGMFGQAQDAAGEHKEPVMEGIDRAAEFAKDKVGDDMDDKIDQGAEAAKDYVEKLDSDDD